jgi:hypothetical protein
MGGQKVERQMKTEHKTLERLQAELREQDEALRTARARLEALGEATVAVDGEELAAIAEACTPRHSSGAPAWPGVRC